MTLFPLTITIPGDPVAKGRPRFFQRGGFVGTYTPKKTRDAEIGIRAGIFRHKPPQPFAGPLVLHIIAYRSIPKSFNAGRRLGAEAGAFVPVTRPDADNYAKLAMDAMNGIMWNDDAQVVRLLVEKRYSITPRLEILIDEYRYNAHADRVGGTE